MAFPEIGARQLRWAPLDTLGIEHLAITPMLGGYVCESVVVGARGGTPYGCVYGLALDGSCRTRKLDIKVCGNGQLVLETEGDGHWFDGHGKALTELSGAIDVDIACTPFTNTLPIRRLDLQAGESAELKMVYIPMPSLTPVIDEQRYTCIEPGRRYLYEAVDRTFSAELEVDEDGLVVDYPTLFRRLVE